MFRNAVITGACGGLGQALARQLIASGTHVVLVGLNRPALQTLADLAPNSTRIYTPDVSNATAMQAMACDWLVHQGVPDLVVANAGVAGGFETADPVDLAVMRRMLENNLLGVATTFQLFYKSCWTADKLVHWWAWPVWPVGAACRAMVPIARARPDSSPICKACAPNCGPAA